MKGIVVMVKIDNNNFATTRLLVCAEKSPHKANISK